MEPDKNHTLLPPAPKTERGVSTFIDMSSSHVLYFNGITIIMRSLTTDSIQVITHPFQVTVAKFSPNFRYIGSLDEKGNLYIHEIQPEKLILCYQYDNAYMGGKDLSWTHDEKKICIVGKGKNRFGKVISVETGTEVG